MDELVLKLILYYYLLLIQRVFSDPQKDQTDSHLSYKPEITLKSRTQNMYPSTHLIQVLKFILLGQYMMFTYNSENKSQS